VRAEFAALLVRIKSIRNMHFYDVVSVNDLLDRLVRDRDSPVVRKQLVLLFQNSYFPQGVGGSSQVARCLALVKKNPEAAMVFYGHVAENASVGSVCKLAALLCRCSLNFVSKRLKDPQEADDDDEEDEDEDDGFSLVGRIVVLEIMACLLKSVYVKVLNDERYDECRSFLAQQLSSELLQSLLIAYSEDRPFDQEALSAIWQSVGYLGELSQGPLLERLVGRLMGMNATSSKKLLDSMIDCLTKWHQLPFLVSKIEEVLIQWTADKYADPTTGTTKAKPTKKTTSEQPLAGYRLHPTVALSAAEYIVQSKTAPCPKHLMDRLMTVLGSCVAPLLRRGVNDVKSLCLSNAFGVVRLVEVYAKLLVLAESASVSQQTSALLESSVAKGNSSAGKEALRSIQPSAFFAPPEPLVDLLEWVATTLLGLRKDLVAGMNQSQGGKKRRRGTKSESDPPGDSSSSVDHELVGRWRNLFSLVVLLSTECVAFSLQREEGLASVGAFVGRVVSVLSHAAATMAIADRAVVYHSCHLLALLEREKLRATKTMDDRAELLTVWTGELQRALETVHANHADKCDDLLTPVMALLSVAAPQAAKDGEEESHRDGIDVDRVANPEDETSGAEDPH
jgi:hypothetical protein